MTPRLPPPILEALAGPLLPHARREELLGDLCERYVSPWRYLVDAFQLVAAARIGQFIRSGGASRRRAAVASRGAATSVRMRMATVLASSRALSDGWGTGRFSVVIWWAALSAHALLTWTAGRTARD